MKTKQGLKKIVYVREKSEVCNTHNDSIISKKISLIILRLAEYLTLCSDKFNYGLIILEQHIFDCIKTKYVV